MGYSSLVNSKVMTNNCNRPRNHPIDTITPHYMCWYTDGATCAWSFVPTSRRASANYCIGRYGDIVLNVDESNRAWTTGSAANDHRAITIECANHVETANGHVYGQLPDATWHSLVALCADICRRHGKKRLVYRGGPDYRGLSSTDMLLTQHKWFQDTDCPGPWFSGQFARLAKEVNAKLAPPEQIAGSPKNSRGLYYRVHIQSGGWMPAVRDGQTAGTTGRSLRVEALKITPPDGVTIDCYAHIQGIGDKVYKGIHKGKSSGTGTSKNDPIIGTTGRGKRLEAIMLRAEGLKKGQRLCYQAHVQGTGWTNVKHAGEWAGTKGKSKRVEAIRMWIEG